MQHQLIRNNFQNNLNMSENSIPGMPMPVGHSVIADILKQNFPSSDQTQKVQGISAGIFNNEICIQFAELMKMASYRCFTELYRKKGTNIDGFREGLIRIQEWGYQKQRDCAQMILTEFGQKINDYYRYTVISFVKDSYMQRTVKVLYHIPEFATFVHYFYSILSKSPELINMSYFQLTPIDKDVLVRGAIRMALFQMMGPIVQVIENKNVNKTKLQDTWMDSVSSILEKEQQDIEQHDNAIDRKMEVKNISDEMMTTLRNHNRVEEWFAKKYPKTAGAPLTPQRISQTSSNIPSSNNSSKTSGTVEHSVSRDERSTSGAKPSEKGSPKDHPFTGRGTGKETSSQSQADGEINSKSCVDSKDKNITKTKEGSTFSKEVEKRSAQNTRETASKQSETSAKTNEKTSQLKNIINRENVVDKDQISSQVTAKQQMIQDHLKQSKNESNIPPPTIVVDMGEAYEENQQAKPKRKRAVKGKGKK